MCICFGLCLNLMQDNKLMESKWIKVGFRSVVPVIEVCRSAVCDELVR